MSLNELPRAGGTSISCYMDEIPAFVESELITLYETLHSSLAFFRIFRPAARASCFVAMRDDRPSTILLFTRRNNRVEVLNEMIEVDQSEVRRFAHYIFMKFEQVDLISFKALKSSDYDIGFPVQTYSSKDTYVIPLPATSEEYTSSIGKSTRTGIRYQTNNLLRNFPSFSSKFFVNEEIDEQHVRQIIKFSENRINAKGLKFSYNADAIVNLAKTCGFVNVFLINGRVCAGSVNYRVGSSFFGEVLAYDAEFEKYGLGKLCVHQTICECIVRGGKRFYLGGGAFEFKHRMLGSLLSMDELHIYRSYSRMVANFDKAGAAIIGAHVRTLKKILHRHKQNPLAKGVFKCFYYFRNRLVK